MSMHTHDPQDDALRDALRTAHAHDPATPRFDAMWQRAVEGAASGEAANEDAEAPAPTRLKLTLALTVTAAAAALILALGAWNTQRAEAPAPQPDRVATSDTRPVETPAHTTASPTPAPAATTARSPSAELAAALQEWESPTDFLLTEEALEDDFLVFADQPPLPGEAPGSTSVPSILELSELEEL